jgi:large subunit ribosomal protein L15
MNLHDLKPTPGSRKARTRVGRGDASGQGGTSGRGHKGSHARSGSKYRPYFEGGQVPLFRRLPKLGAANPNHKFYSLVNVAALADRFEANDVVDMAALEAKGMIRGSAKCGLKILGNGELDKPLTVRAKKFSAAAKAKIEAVGGTCEIDGA